ncbi:cytochrome c biogenesis protein CcsA [Tengunoibacter tsumagoiensis]|uniref:Heme exporter protein C n=1 Tax=Tengunoibacter tsumagoiensis TaxID=2014871 RepID=A0A402A5I6_9CHLR|nr:cytochrome c biogenesis protein CcsA [Tengunoibacter tsumagoiensis]GCE14372.1 cytochrome C biogenesis protein CcmC [Tengunoibacter tsumagoiensis]
MAFVHQEQSVSSKKEIQEKQQPHVQRFPWLSLILGGLSGAGMLYSLWLIFVYAPLDAVQGLPQKIFYFHVPAAWIGMLAFVVMAIAGVIYLIKPDDRWDWLARASAEIGAVFLTLALITGSIWAKTTWGTWWTWDPQLTAALILWFMFIAYLMLLSSMGRTVTAARAAAVLAIVGALDVPIIYEATNWWRTLHPSHEVGTSGALPPEVVLTILVSLLSFTLLYSFLLIQIYHFQRLQTLAQRLRASVAE